MNKEAALNHLENNIYQLLKCSCGEYEKASVKHSVTCSKCGKELLTRMERNGKVKFICQAVVVGFPFGSSHNVGL